MVLNLTLVWHLAHAGLALATSLSAFLNAGLLFTMLYRQGVFRIEKGWALFIVRLFFANGIMLIMLWWFNPEMSQWYDWSFWYKMMVLLLICALGFVTYIAVLFVSGYNFRQIQR